MKKTEPESLPVWARSEQIDAWLARLGFFGIVLLSFLMSFHTLFDTDLFWHLKTGELIIKHHQVPEEDLYTFTMLGKEWIDAQWLFQVLIYLLYRISGYSGMVWFAALLSALTWFLILKTFFQKERYLSSLFIGFLCLLIQAFRLNLRPELLTFFYLALELFLLQRYLTSNKRAIYFLPLLLLFWLNSQGLWPIYFAVLGAFVLEEMFFLLLGFQSYFKRSLGNAPRSELIPLGLCLLVSVPVTFFNPYGFRGVIFPLRLFQEISSPQSFIGNFILEFYSPFYREFPWLDRFTYGLLIVVSILILLVSVFQKRVYPAGFSLWGIFLYLSLTAVRNVALFAMITAILVGRILTDLPALKIPDRIHLPVSRVQLRRTTALALLGLLLWFMIDVITNRFYIRNASFCRFGTGVLPTEYPIRATQFLQTLVKESNPSPPLKIFCDIRNAGYLIWTGYPDWLVYVDPRMEVHGEERIKRYAQAINIWKVFKEESDRYNFPVVILSSYFEKKDLILNLFRDPDWSLVYLDALNVIFLKNQSEFSSLIPKYQINFSQNPLGALPENLGAHWLAKERLNRGYLLSLFGYPELALPELEAGVKLEPNNFNLNYYLGLTYNQLHKPEQAKPYLEKALKLEPNAVQALILLGRTYALLREPARAVPLLQKALKREPEEINACIELAFIYEMLEDERARDQWQKCHAIYQRSPEKFKSQERVLLKAIRRLDLNP